MNEDEKKRLWQHKCLSEKVGYFAEVDTYTLTGNSWKKDAGTQKQMCHSFLFHFTHSDQMVRQGHYCRNSPGLVAL